LCGKRGKGGEQAEPSDASGSTDGSKGWDVRTRWSPTASPERREKGEPMLRSNLDKVKCREKIARVLMFDHSVPPIHPLSRVI
jgi:hypothetical protein